MKIFLYLSCMTSIEVYCILDRFRLLPGMDMYLNLCFHEPGLTTLFIYKTNRQITGGAVRLPQPPCLFSYIPTKNLQYILLNNTTYKILYSTTTTLPFGAKNSVYLMATNNRKHKHSTTRYDLREKDSTKITRHC